MAVQTQLFCTDVGLSFGPQTILTSLSLTVAPGDRVGVVGRNGSGKTTLLRVLSGELAPDSGVVGLNPPDATVGILDQQLASYPGETVLDFVTRRTGVTAVVAEFEASLEAVTHSHPGAADRYDAALARYLAVDAATIAQRTAAILDTVGLHHTLLERRTDQLSGGQQTRVNLAAMLLASFDVLLLDEPTNDLDQAGLSLLEDTLLSNDQAMVIVSHDREFLDRVVTSVYELDEHSRTGTRYNGGYAAWLDAREIERQHQYEAFEEYQSKRSQLKDRAQQQQRWATTGVQKAKNDKSEQDKFIRAARIASSESVAASAKQTLRAMERLERNEKVDKPWEGWELRLDFRPAERSGTEVAVLHRAVMHQGEFVLGPVDVALTAGDRVLVTGENGSGKTTLLRALFGEIALADGTHYMGPSVVMATLGQDRDAFGQAESLLRGFAEQADVDGQTARSQLAKLDLTDEQIQRPPSQLSPGERTRASLGVFAARGTNLLVLDEPTNHLDLEAIEQLESALERFPHTLVVVTHDRRLRQNLRTTRQWDVADGGVTES